MKFTLSHKDIYSHFVLSDTEQTIAIAATPEWKEDKTLDVQMQINGVDVDPAILQKLMGAWIEQVKESTLAKVDVNGFEDRVKKEVNKILQTKANEVLEVMGDLQNKLQCADLLLKYEWEQ